MYCPLGNKEIGKVCEIRCLYRTLDNKCAYRNLCSEEDLTAEDISKGLGVDLEEVKKSIQAAYRRIQVALVFDSYLDYLKFPKTVNNSCEKTKDKVPAVLALFNLTKDQLNYALQIDKYEEWRRLSKVDISFKDIQSLFKGK